MKPWPCCRHTHPAIDAALELHREMGNAAVRRVVVGTYKAAIDVCDRPRPQEPYTAKFSLQHCVAVALAEGEVVQSSFNAEARERVAAEMAKVELVVSPETDAAYPKSWGAEISVEMKDGRTFRAVRREAKGDPENPVDSNELSAKGRTLLAEGGLSAAEGDKLIAAILGLAEDRPVRDLRLFMRDGAERRPSQMAPGA